MFKISRRTFLGASASATTLPLLASAGSHRGPGDQRLWYSTPAASWDEALPIGNGRLGAMIFGRVSQERLQLNEDTLWAGAPYTPDNPDALHALPEVRQLLAAGKFQEAATLASAKVMAKPLSQMSYGTLGDLLINVSGATPPASYERSLDLQTAVAVSRYETASGAFTRRAFVSAPHQAIVLKFDFPDRTTSLELAYRGPRKVRYTSPASTASATLAANKSIDWLETEAVGLRESEYQVQIDGPDAILVTGRNSAGPGTAAGLTFALRVCAVTDGKVTPGVGGINIERARSVLFVISGATSFVRFDDVSGDPVAKVRLHTSAAAKRSYASLEREHVREYQSHYRSMSLELPATPAARKPTNVRILEAEISDDPTLAILYFQFARYLLISSSRPGCQPANLQGIWNEGVNPPWGSKYTININTEMNYWPADPAGLGACVEPLQRMVEELAVTGARTAKAMYGARGWVAHHNTDLWRAAAPIDGPQWGLWPCGGAWLCNTLWDHYDYGRSEDALKRLYPLMLGASLFFLDTLVEDPHGRGLVTSPSLSPENVHAFGTSLCVGPAMDRQIIRDLFSRTVSAGKQLEIDGPLLAELEHTAKRLLPDAIGKGGQLQEWLEDWDDSAPDQHHRHVSHLYAVYPSSQINVRDTPALVDAAKESLRRRGDLATGWGTAWRLCLWARMGEGEHAHSILKALLGPQRTYPNMFDAHPPFQIDGNFGGAAGIMEMILQSWGNEIHLLPALPAAWPRGTVRGIRARGAISVSMGWNRGEVSWLELKGPARQEVRLRFRKTSRTVKLDERGTYRGAGG